LYRRLKTILIYPGAYVAGKKGVFGYTQDKSVRLGESWHSGVVVLSWDDVQHGGRDFKDGHNVTLHEFAHQLDQEDGVADGAPLLEQRTNYIAWARVLSKEYKNLCRKTRKGRPSVLRRYGATNPAEFFAVATETFFEKPRQMQTKHPELYEELRDYYKLNPVEWHGY
jgi:Mlc titration factor MtfA (ptsG expression regulator)